MTLQKIGTKNVDGSQNIKSLMQAMGEQAQAAAKALALASTEQKDTALKVAADTLLARADSIIEANQKDVAFGEAKGLSAAMIDRLKLDQERIEGIANGLNAICDLKDPVSDVIANWQQPSGLDISRVRVPLGVIGVIYESRPNVTADAGALCLKAGNAVILRGGSEAFHSNTAIYECLLEGLKAADLPEDAIQLVPTRDRVAVGEMLSMTGLIDIIVPRGGRSLVERVQTESRVPVFAHLEGICHVYVDAAADAAKATEITLNAKLRRTGVCGAAETLLLDHALDTNTGQAIVKALLDAGCEVRGCSASMPLDARIKPASEDDWRTEYLDAIISVKMVGGIDEAISHVAEYSSGHTETVITEDVRVAEKFLTEVDSAIVMHNASTQFADGGEFGMGAEIGIATGRIHARGPIGLEQLTSFKYQVRGSGQTRP